jgi:hypothetical protein
MNIVRYAAIIGIITTLAVPCLAKRPKKEKPKHNNTANVVKETEQEDDTLSGGYHPNPAILAGVGQILNGALTIAQNPHSRPNVGHSVASMIHGIMTIIVEKIAHKRIDPVDRKALQDCCNEVCSDISKEITEIIIQKKLKITHTLN